MHRWRVLTDFERTKKIICHFANFEQLKKIICPFVNFEQAKKINSCFVNSEQTKNNNNHFTNFEQAKKKKIVVLLRLFYSVETFLWCGDFQCSLRCKEFSTMWRLFFDVETYRIWNRFMVGGHVKSCVFYLFGHRAIQSTIK